MGNRNDEQDVEIVTKDATLRANRHILARHSEYFSTCFKEPFAEAGGVVRLDGDDEIESRYLSYYIGLAYSYSSIFPQTPPTPAANPECSAPKRALRDYVEVFKLCDRFLSPVMGKFIMECIKTAIGDGHRALYRAPTDNGLQKVLMRDFAEGYEALQLSHTTQMELGEQMIAYFCDGVHYATWDSSMGEVAHRPRFVGAVSRRFARKLAEYADHGRKQKRKELTGP